MTDTIKALKKAFDDLRFVERMCLVDPPHPAKELDVGYRIGLVRKDLEAALAAPQPEPLSMSMFANRADYEEALKAQPQPICPACHGPGLLYECVWCSAKNHPPEPQPTIPSDQDVIENLMTALQWYANGEHFCKCDPNAWDTVSGEPQNWWCDEAGTAMVEDGSLAKMVLSGEITGAQLQAMEDGEVFEPQPFKQESWITAARLVVEATPEQLPMAIDAMRDLVEGAKP